MEDKKNRTFIFGLILMFVCGIGVAINLADIERGNGNYVSLIIQSIGVITGYMKVIKTTD